jgi:hypothetical protein
VGEEMSGILGTGFEYSLRILLLLEAGYKRKFTDGEISSLDFIAINGGDFGIAEKNLHGESNYRYGELAARHTLVKEAIKSLVLDGLVTAEQTKSGFRFSLSADGLDFISELDSDYANDYFTAAQNTLKTMQGKTERQLDAVVNRMITSSVGKEEDDGELLH